MKYKKLRLYLCIRRLELGYSQYQVAAKLGVCHQHYSRIENGFIGSRITFATMIKISKALKISLDELSSKEIEYQMSLYNQTDQ